MSSKREEQRLHDILENIDAIAAYSDGMTFSEFSNDRKTVDATERCLERIAEAAVKIGPERMAQIAPDLPFERVRGLGNLLRHAYDIIDLEQIYVLIDKDLPPFRRRCAQALGA